RGHAHKQAAPGSGERLRAPAEPERADDPHRPGIDLGQRSGEPVADPQGMRGGSYVTGPVPDRDRVSHDPAPGSIREMVPSSRLAAHTAPALTAMAVGPVPTGMASCTSPVAGSRRSTR